METDLILKEIDQLHEKANAATNQKDVVLALDHFDPDMKYTNADATIYNKSELTKATELYFGRLKSISTTHYRIKSTFEADVFTEKIARKSVIYLRNLLIFSKKQTIQTEEVLTWKKRDGKWKVAEVEIVLEEKY